MVLYDYLQALSSMLSIKTTYLASKNNCELDCLEETEDGAYDEILEDIRKEFLAEITDMVCTRICNNEIVDFGFECVNRINGGMQFVDITDDLLIVFNTLPMLEIGSRYVFPKETCLRFEYDNDNLVIICSNNIKKYLYN